MKSILFILAIPLILFSQDQRNLIIVDTDQDIQYFRGLHKLFYLGIKYKTTTFIHFHDKTISLSKEVPVEPFLRTVTPFKISIIPMEFYTGFISPNSGLKDYEFGLDIKPSININEHLDFVIAISLLNFEGEFGEPYINLISKFRFIGQMYVRF